MFYYIIILFPTGFDVLCTLLIVTQTKMTPKERLMKKMQAQLNKQCEFQEIQIREEGGWGGGGGGEWIEGGMDRERESERDLVRTAEDDFY